MKTKQGSYIVVSILVGLCVLPPLLDSYGLGLCTIALVLVVVRGNVRSRVRAIVEGERDEIVWLPLAPLTLRHNERARLIRSRELVQQKWRTCDELVDALAESQSEADKLRKPIVEAERDAAKLENIRITEDIKRLERSWVREDLEREYERQVSK